MLITREHIKINDESYLVVRKLKDTTTDEQADQIHRELNTDTLIRDNQGRWYCCFKVKDVEFRDVNIDEPEVQQEVYKTIDTIHHIDKLV